MPVKHNLFADLQQSKEEVENRAKSDDRLSQLLTQYHVSDADVVKAEDRAAPDDEVRKLKEKRLLIKDKIVQHLG
ncbi:hypothetical protein IFT98_18970 [Pseudomonas sp. CFBP 8770]|uniref:hypothetical protein n=1 Tax=unclassified Pseudomonas TaxID=196821 RepID=UPI0017820492|nr:MULTISPECIES: hypothetical protein [unclassified Pseudomonas]MBD8476298.1 hypothetical protein [Pseudomonas sp. CFBP 8773]MBD8649080.1 hypothetical protein [Pseudomonas sp. CFBP 8770]